MTELTLVGLTQTFDLAYRPHIRRTILVSLPPGYEDSDTRYPVVYLHNEQPSGRPTPAPDNWPMAEALEVGRRSGSPAIIVGVPPLEPPAAGGHVDGDGSAAPFLDFLVNALKPHIDQTYRSAPGREHTGVLGTALSLEAFFRHRAVFGFAGVMRSAQTLASDALAALVAQAEMLPGTLYLDIGQQAQPDVLRAFRRMCALLIDKGFRPGSDILCIEEPATETSDYSWQERLEVALRFLLSSPTHSPPSPTTGERGYAARAIWPGQPYPLGATWDGQGVNFALYAESASAVDLCLFDTPDAPAEAERIRMPEQTDRVWHGYLPGIQPGQLYGYRVSGPHEPDQGQRYNPSKLLVDPYAKALTRAIAWNDAVFGYRVGDPDEDRSYDERDSAPFMPRCVVPDGAFEWGDDQPPRTPLSESIVYELHVKGFTRQHPQVPENMRGTYAGLAYPPVVDYLRSLGVTAVELLPIHHHVDDRHLVERGLRNYWGYNTLSFFAPDARYSSAGSIGQQILEFKGMVRTLHTAGIEVILDVVYNHTAEGNHLGPMLSMKGIENTAYYRLVAGQPRYYMDYTGTGNSLNMLHPRTLQLIMDSLRYWVQEMHVDGFRFDLAATLARGLHEQDRLSAFFDLIHQDPVLSQVKLIAEPWDVGPGGYQVGHFPVLWAEWNGKYRDTVRRFWKGDPAQVAELAYRLTGSSDLYESTGRRPSASINFITAHDGFTLRDLVSYNEKHNEANGEENRDGERHNSSWNCGAEGESEDADINALRARQQRNMLATLLLSQGVPMLLAGDELGRTQRGNNNAYCQDNAISWLDWHPDAAGRALLDVVRQLIALRKAHPALRRRSFFQGRSIHGLQVPDISWHCPDGQEMSEAAWQTTAVRSLGLLLNGTVMDEWDTHGNHVHDDMLLLLLNAHDEMIPFTLPGGVLSADWEVLIDTAADVGAPVARIDGASYPLAARSLALLCLRVSPGAQADAQAGVAGGSRSLL